MQQDVVTHRDWAILRAMQQLQAPEIVLESLRLSGFDDNEEPWTAGQVQERFDFLCRSVRVAARLVGRTDGVRAAREMHELVQLCL
jgi:hypothetical protein